LSKIRVAAGNGIRTATGGSTMLDRRRGGVLLHPTSLPSAFGIGDLGPAAYSFLEFLARAKQSLWQVLPLGPTGFGDSPYASPSAFAGNPWLIGLEPLIDQGFLQPDADRSLLDALAGLPQASVDFGNLHALKARALQTAFERGRVALRDQLETFHQAQAAWLDDFALFSALRDEHGAAWTNWAPPLRARDRHALDGARDELRERIDYYVFVQFVFFEQWRALRARAHELGIRIIGDIPIFVAHDSADVWAHPGLFKLDADGTPTVVAGVPPDYFSATGQLWGNPLYDWDAMAETGYAWWIARLRNLLELVDLARIDHFRGFEAAWEVPFSASTAIEGSWVKGPGPMIFNAVGDDLGAQPPVIAEDLGLITDDVRELLRVTGFPGMKVLQFAFGDDARNPYLPHNYVDPNCVVYTGTHDNTTTLDWFASASEAERGAVLRYLGSDGSRIALDLVRLALGSIANTAIVPLQDMLELDGQARMNTPGAAAGNWTWRYRSDQLDAGHARCLAELTATYGRD
jgi:4-alpha-glucanotransferase